MPKGYELAKLKMNRRTSRRELIASCLIKGVFLSHIKKTVRTIERQTYHFELKYI